ncbi:MAG TPA: methyltransferase domain-containing protein [Pyrinomonadaceae bacterium]|jgi:SAM-dependent methyltransferase/glycosyltransferase involved in cell wall biosynthesis|nr:methyltransferase domain-containing protein [Pyrinomonadaceae bacterium]
MKLCYFSPLNPQRSGISDYSEELLPHLADGADITLFVDGFAPSNRELTARSRCFDYRSDPSVLQTLADCDAVVYQMGNDHRYHAGIFEAMRARPGIVVFHDFALQDFFLGLARARGDIGIYLDEVAACHGPDARREASEALSRGGLPSMLARPTDFPLNCRIARDAEAIIVHSEWSRARFEQIAPGVPVARIDMPVRPNVAAAQTRAVNNNGREGEVVIANFGLITPGKGIEQALRALSALKETHEFRYTLVGEPNPFFDVRELVRRYGMEDRVEITGHVSLAEFERRICETDIALNMRERTVGETSASLCRIMSAGVASVVSNVGWYAELPGDCVVKIDPDEYADAMLKAYLARLIEDARLRSALGERARRHALASHDASESAARYLDFIRDTIARRPRRRFVERVTSEMSLLGATADDELFMRGVAAEVSALAPARLFDGGAASAPDSNGDRANGNGAGALRAGAPASIEDDKAADSPSRESVNGRASKIEPAEAVLETSPRAHAADNSRMAATQEGRLPKIEGIDYKRAAVEYPQKLDAERSYYLKTKPFYNLANKPDKHTGDGMDAETHRHFCDFANMAAALALPAGSRILDVGCGSGWLSEYFARLGYEVRGVDISPDLIDMSRERLSLIPYGADFETPLRCTFDVHDIERAPLDEKFDAVICYDSLHHFEDERAVVRHLAAMLDVGGLLFILEGVRPPDDSATERELRDVMLRYETLESPFSYEYLCELLDENGFAVVGDYVSVNGLFEREMLEGDQLPLRTLATDYHYLTCKKVVEGGAANSVPDSRRPGLLRARISLSSPVPELFAPGATLEAPLRIENMGDTLWLAGQTVRAGVVMPAVRVFDEAGTLVSEFHGRPMLPRAVAPGETVALKIQYGVPARHGAYTLKIDLVDQHVCWFEDAGSKPLVLRFQV